MRLVYLLPLLFLSSCQNTLLGTNANEQCGAAGAQALVGVQASSIDSASLPTGTRIIHPDTAVTRDYRAERLNVHVDEAGRVERVVCG